MARGSRAGLHHIWLAPTLTKADAPANVVQICAPRAWNLAVPEVLRNPATLKRGDGAGDRPNPNHAVPEAAV
jgi:hypothetical protein